MFSKNIHASRDRGIDEIIVNLDWSLFQWFELIFFNYRPQTKESELIDCAKIFGLKETKSDKNNLFLLEGKLLKATFQHVKDE